MRILPGVEEGAALNNLMASRKEREQSSKGLFSILRALAGSFLTIFSQLPEGISDLVE